MLVPFVSSSCWVPFVAKPFRRCRAPRRPVQVVYPITQDHRITQDQRNRTVQGVRLTFMRLSLVGLASGLCLVAYPGLAASSSDVYSRLPLRFEALESQKWIAHGPGFGVGFSPDGTFFR